MTDREILDIALAQSAIDMNCQPVDFLRQENVIVRSQDTAGHRKYLHLPFLCNLVSYGGNVVASVSEEAEGIVRDYLSAHETYTCFETPALLTLDNAFQSLGHRLCFMAEYFLPDLKKLQELPCDYDLRLMGPADFTDLYRPEWHNALSMDRREADVLGVGAFDGNRMIGMAACSADCDSMWQIGVDVLPDYRRRGIASALTSRLALEILSRDKVPFYCAAWSNLKSVRNAIKVGFRPAWIELTAKPTEFVMSMIAKGH